MRRNSLQNNPKPISRNYKYLLLSVLTLASTIYIVGFIPPSQGLKIIGFEISILFLFFPILSLFIFSLITFITGRLIHGFLISGFSVLYLLFRLAGFTHIIFLILIVAILISLELFFSKK